jgi:choline transport protein
VLVDLLFILSYFHRSNQSDLHNISNLDSLPTIPKNPIMSKKEKANMEIDRVHSADFVSSESQKIDHDAMKLVEMGYAQDMKRNFSLWSVLGVGFSLTNSWFGVSAALVTGINSGGAVLLVYGIIGVFLISICVGISLSELASAFPNAGGQYFWASELAPRRYASFASYATGWFAWAGASMYTPWKA